MICGDISYAATTPKCGDVNTSIINCAPSTNNNGSTGIENTGIGSVLISIINIMAAGVGIMAVGGIVYASVLYASAAGSAEQVKKAKEMIRNVIIGVVLYGLMYGLLNYIIPGGVFNR